MTSFIYQTFSELSHVINIYGQNILQERTTTKPHLRKWCGFTEDTQEHCVKSEETWKLVFSVTTKKLKAGGERNL